MTDQLNLSYPKPLTTNLPDAFRKLYFNLYTNGKASRSERLIEDLSLILLSKLAFERDPDAAELRAYRKNAAATADTVLIPVLKRTFPGLVDDRQRFSIGDKAVRSALTELDGVQLSTAPAHVLGEAFQALAGPRLRGDKGQFFTPRSLVHAIVEIVAPMPNESVLDPACGTGGFLVEAHAFQSRAGTANASLIGVDKDHDLFRLSSAVLHITAKNRGHTFEFNALDAAQWSVVGDELFDVVLTNPPFGTRIGLRDETILNTYSLGHQWVFNRHDSEWRMTPIVLGTQAPQVLFLELCVRKLKPGGRLGIVLPEGIFGNKGDAYIWHWLKSQGAAYALLDCPRTMFQPGTDTKTNVLFFKKGVAQTPRSNADKVRVAVAIRCGHDRRGRIHLSDGSPQPNDLPQLAREFHRSSTKGPWRDVRVDSTYMVPRYYAKETFASTKEARWTRTARMAYLKELVEEGVITIRKGHEVGSDAYGTGDVPFVRTSDLANFEISVDPTKSVSVETYNEFAPQQALRPGDVLIVADGRYRIGTTAILTKTNHRCVVQSHLRIISIEKSDILDPYELLYALSMPSTRLKIRNLVFIQSTLGTLGRRLLELRIPMLHGQGPWQHQICQFRDALRKRDELLRHFMKMNRSYHDV